jgi:purine-nucleoside phosphorylase
MTIPKEGLYARVQEAAAAVRGHLAGLAPRCGIILGTGLGRLAEEIRGGASMPYADIPRFVRTSVEGHAGRLVWGRIGKTGVVAMEGRFHAYEGYTPEEITLPVRVMRALGCDTLVVSNACGGMNPQYDLGDLMVIEDHINLMGTNPLVGPNDERLGPRFPDMSVPYDRGLLDRALAIALEERIRCHKGVYVAVTGPNLETRAEYRFLRTVGADVVGMSTVPEVIAAVHAGMKVLGLSVVTDRCLPDALAPADIRTILKVAAEAEPKLARIVRRVVEGL